MWSWRPEMALTKPIRAGMVMLPEHYPWSDYRVNALGGHDELLCPHSLYLQLGTTDGQRQEAYRALFVNAIEPIDLEGLRGCLQSDAPLGDERFRTQTEQVLQMKVSCVRRGRSTKNQV
jgi:putative transposase